MDVIMGNQQKRINCILKLQVVSLINDDLSFVLLFRKQTASLQKFELK